MLTRERITQLLEKLNTLLAERGELGEIGLVGGAVMCLVYNARVATKDVDAIFEPASIAHDGIPRIKMTSLYLQNSSSLLNQKRSLRSLSPTIPAIGSLRRLGLRLRSCWLEDSAIELKVRILLQ